MANTRTICRVVATIANIAWIRVCVVSVGYSWVIVVVEIVEISVVAIASEKVLIL